MERRVMLAAWLALSSLALFGATLRVTSPNGGETVRMGSIQRITWEATDISQQFRIVLMNTGGSRFGKIVENLASDRRSYDWSVPETLAGDAPEGRYRIRVVTMDGGIHDDSDTDFSIAVATEPPPAATLQLLSPNGGETLILNQPTPIRWSQTGLRGTVRLVLIAGNTDAGDVASGLDAAAGQYAWTAGRKANGDLAAEGTDYRIRVQSEDSSGVYDSSDRAFSLAPFTVDLGGLEARQIRVTRPVRGAALLIGSLATIEWTPPDINGVDIGSTVRLSAVRQSDHRTVVFQPRQTNVPGVNSYLWSIDPAAFRDFTGEYLIRVDSSSGLRGESARFQLVNPGEATRLYSGIPETDLVLGVFPTTMQVTHLLGGGNSTTHAYRINITLRLRNDRREPMAEIREVECRWHIENKTDQRPEWRDVNVQNQRHSGSITLGPFRHNEWTTQNVTIDFDHGHAAPGTMNDEQYRMVFELVTPPNINDHQQGNNTTRSPGFYLHHYE